MVKTMFKKFLCIFFSLIICCISAAVPFSYAADEDSEQLPDYYYYGNSDYIPICSELYSKAYQKCLSSNKTVYSDFAVIYSASQNKAWVFFYTATPVFDFYADYTSDTKKGYSEYRSQTLRWHYFLFDTSSMSFVTSDFNFQNPSYPFASIYSYSDGNIRFNTGINYVEPLDLIVSSFEFEGFSFSSGSGSVEVTFNPSFSLDMNKDLYTDRLAFGGSSSSTGSHFTMTVNNSLKNPIQVRMYITGKGESFDLGEVSAGPTHTGYQNRNWNCDFIFMKEDWVFAPDISTGNTSESRLQYKPTSWHFVNTQFNQSVSWSSINCIENEEYDVVVEYVELTPDDIYADTTLVSDDRIVECYRQTFSIYKRSVAYDPTNEDFGVLNIHGYDDYLTAENSSSGYVDDDGKTQIKQSLNVNPNLYGSGSSSSGSRQLYSGTNFSLSSLQMSTRNVLSFFQYVFGYFPSQVWNAFYFILVCIVVFAFIKLLKG